MTPVRFLRFTLMIAILFASIGMVGGRAAMAMPDAGAADSASYHQMAGSIGHCGDQKQKDQSGPEIDCMMACSGLLAANFDITSDAIFPATIPPAPHAHGHRGLHPESDPPPPRSV